MVPDKLRSSPVDMQTMIQGNMAHREICKLVGAQGNQVIFRSGRAILPADELIEVRLSTVAVETRGLRPFNSTIICRLRRLWQ